MDDAEYRVESCWSQVIEKARGDGFSAQTVDLAFARTMNSLSSTEENVLSMSPDAVKWLDVVDELGEVLP